ncbi:Paladin [Frankliniella fusca]|uniref:Paladin n=1 Tax=Frankliniella fusca TaxID=407009 RepID=A0AAE1H943_9NEOP|nr:Paladin [Frankliniella fusca]
MHTKHNYHISNFKDCIPVKYLGMLRCLLRIVSSFKNQHTFSYNLNTNSGLQRRSDPFIAILIWCVHSIAKTLTTSIIGTCLRFHHSNSTDPSEAEQHYKHISPKINNNTDTASIFYILHKDQKLSSEIKIKGLERMKDR